MWSLSPAGTWRCDRLGAAPSWALVKRDPVYGFVVESSDRRILGSYRRPDYLRRVMNRHGYKQTSERTGVTR